MRLRLGFILASVLAVTATGCASSGGGTSTPGAGGMRPRQTAETRAAEKALNVAMVAGPEQGAAQFEEALTAARAGITADSANPLAYKLAGQALIGLTRLEEADAMLDKAEELRPLYVAEETEGIREQAWIDTYTRAQPLLDSGDYLGAAKVLEGANAIFQQRPEIMIVLGQIYVQENEPDKAVLHLRMADSLIDARVPEVDSALAADWRAAQADIPVQIAQAFISAERFEEAAGELRTLVAENPDNVVYQNNLASIYVQTNQPDLAAGVYEGLLRRPDLSPSDIYNVGVGYYNLQRYQDAANSFKRAVTMATKERDAIEMWARSIQVQIQRDTSAATPQVLQELIGVAEKWVELDPNSRTGLTILTQAVYRSGNEDRTVQLIERNEGLAVGVTDLVLARNPAGGATVEGAVENVKAAAGTRLNLVFTFYNRQGNAIGTQAVQVTTGAPGTGNQAAGSRAQIRVDFASDQQVDGYSYVIQ